MNFLAVYKKYAEQFFLCFPHVIFEKNTIQHPDLWLDYSSKCTILHQKLKKNPYSTKVFILTLDELTVSDNPHRCVVYGIN